MKQKISMVCGVVLLLLGLTDAAVGADSGWVWPLQPRPHVVRSFEPPAGPYASGHRGVDLGGRVGQLVHATADGVVMFAGLVAGKGVVVVAHGEERSTYQPVSAAVLQNESVNAGQPLGRLQLGGSHCWPQACLHLGRVVGEDYLDPLDLLGAGPVRLLPLSGAPLNRGERAPLAFSRELARVPAVRHLAGWWFSAPQAGWLGQARGCASRYACRSLSVDTWV